MNIPPCINCKYYATLSCPLFNADLPLESCQKLMESEEEDE